MLSLPLLDLGCILLVILIVVSSLVGLDMNLCMVYFSNNLYDICSYCKK